MQKTLFYLPDTLRTCKHAIVLRENPQISICFLYLFMQFFKNFPEYRIDTKQ